MHLFQNDDDKSFNVEIGSIFQLITIILIFIIIIANILTLIVLIVGKKNAALIKIQNVQLLIASITSLIGFLLQAFKLNMCQIILGIRHLGIMSVNISCIFTVYTHDVMLTTFMIDTNRKQKLIITICSILGTWIPSLAVSISIIVFKFTNKDNNICQLDNSFAIFCISFYALFIFIMLFFVIKINRTINSFKKKKIGSSVQVNFRFTKKMVLYFGGIIIYFISWLVVFPIKKFQLEGNEKYLIVLCVINPIITYIYIWNNAFFMDLKDFFCDSCCCKKYTDYEESIHEYFREEDSCNLLIENLLFDHLLCLYNLCCFYYY